jgi:hypothetical protein
VSVSYPCPVCHARKGEPCMNTIQPGLPLPGRVEHFGRALPPERRVGRVEK